MFQANMCHTSSIRVSNNVTNYSISTSHPIHLTETRELQEFSEVFLKIEGQSSSNVWYASGTIEQWIFRTHASGQGSRSVVPMEKMEKSPNGTGPKTRRQRRWHGVAKGHTIYRPNISASNAWHKNSTKKRYFYRFILLTEKNLNWTSKTYSPIRKMYWLGALTQNAKSLSLRLKWHKWSNRAFLETTPVVLWWSHIGVLLVWIKRLNLLSVSKCIKTD